MANLFIQTMPLINQKYIFQKIIRKYFLLLQQNLIIKKLPSNTKMSSQILEDMQMLNLNFQSTKKLNKPSINNKSSAIRSNSKKKSLTDRMNNSSHFNPSKSINLMEDFRNDTGSLINHNDSKANTDRQNLIQKKKSYAQSIRQKNKIELQKKKSTNANLLLTPPNQKYDTLQESFQHQGITDRSKQLKNSTFKNKNQSCFLFEQCKTQDNVLGESNRKTNANKEVNSSSKSKIRAVLGINSVNSKKDKENSQNIQSSQRKSSCHKIQLNSKNALKESNNPLSNTASRRIAAKKQKQSLKSMFNESIQLPQQQQTIVDNIYSKTRSSKKINNDPNKARIHTKFFVQQNKINEFKIEQLSQIQIQEQQNDNKCQKKQTLKIGSNLVNQTIDFSQLYSALKLQEDKQILILKKHNATFKKQLAHFRKQNGSVKKQLDNSKKYAKQLEQRTQQLIIIQKQLRVNMENVKRQINKQVIVKEPDSLEEILKNKQQQLFYTKGENKALQLKVYLLQKKISQQQENHRKRMAIEISHWRQKYNRLRNQHLKSRDVNNYYLNADCSIDMELSHDQ